MRIECATIEFIQKMTLKVTVPIVLQNYINKTANRSFLLTSSIPGKDLNKVPKTLNNNKKIKL